MNSIHLPFELENETDKSKKKMKEHITYDASFANKYHLPCNNYEVISGPPPKDRDPFINKTPKIIYFFC